MPTYDIRGVTVNFPYDAYDCQLVYMDRVIQSLQNKCNALLESPTGTGKTLCLLCATLAWRKSLSQFSTGKFEKEFQNSGGSSPSDGSQSQTKSILPTIVYTSRTHSQLRQVIHELRRTSYRPKMVVLGSREQLCIHKEVSLLHGSAQNNACHYLLKKGTKHRCSHYHRVTDFVQKGPFFENEPIDIEDLVNIGRTHGPCPYYLSRELHKSVDILFAPYSYLIDGCYRKSLNISWDDSILIFDEAHNLEALCADAASFDLPSGLLTACISEAKKCIDLSVLQGKKQTSNDKPNDPDKYSILKALLLKLENRIAEVPIDSKEVGFTKPGPYIYELLQDLNINQGTVNMFSDIVKDAVLLLQEDSDASNDGMHQKTNGTACRLESLGEILELIFRDDVNSHAEFYRVHVREAEKWGSDSFKASRVLSWWCFNPGLALQVFSGLHVGSIILTSGTLSPMDTFAQELKLKFPVQLENPHVISADQIWAGIVPSGPSGYHFNSSYQTRSCQEYKQEVGNTIVNIARIVPDGLLVFFPSYYLLESCVDFWKGCSSSLTSSTIWERICKHKLPVIEPKNSSQFLISIEDYMRKLKDNAASGAIFFAVCRGKVSEGLDFADHSGRAVLVIGIPFATWMDPKVRLKRDYLDQQTQKVTESKLLTGEEWYNQQASRAVNQAVGRVIRHRNDYGAIIFCDERFMNSYRQAQVSHWIQPYIKCYPKFGDVVYTLTQFFRGKGTRDCTEVKPTESLGPIVPAGGATLSTEKDHLERFFSSLGATASHGSSVKSLSTFSTSKVNNSIRNIRGVIPSNISSLSTRLPFCSDSNPTPTNEKKPIHLLMKNETLERTSDPVMCENPGIKEIIIPCSAKGSMEICEKKTVSNGTARGCSFAAERVDQKQASCFVQRSKRIKSDDIPGESVTEHTHTSTLSRQSKMGNFDEGVGGHENGASGFLNQVKAKLSPTDYKEFVGLLKTIKSDKSKAGEAVKSIVALFSSSGGRALLERFKDYLPSKYHSLYQEYVETANGHMAHL